MPVCLVTSERADNNIGCVLTFSGQSGSFLVSAIGAFHAEDSRVSGIRLMSGCKNCSEDVYHNLRKSERFCVGPPWSGCIWATRKNPLISRLAPPPRRWENQVGFLRAVFGKGAITLCLRMTEKIEEYDEMTCES